MTMGDHNHELLINNQPTPDHGVSKLFSEMLTFAVAQTSPESGVRDVKILQVGVCAPFSRRQNK